MKTMIFTHREKQVLHEFMEKLGKELSLQEQMTAIAFYRLGRMYEAQKAQVN